MTTEIAPSCPISYSEYPSNRTNGINPRSPIGHLQDQINRIPRAHDLPSAIHALNVMSHIILQLTRGEPQINNVYPQGAGGVIMKGQEFGQQYDPADWLYEGREYNKQRLVNPDDETQYIEIKVLKTVTFFTYVTDYRLFYDGPLKWGK
jgi:hypothetical protein